MGKHFERLKAALAEQRRRCVEAFHRLRERLRELDGKSKKRYAIGAVLAAVALVVVLAAVFSAGNVPAEGALDAIAWDDAYLSDSSAALLLTDGQVDLRYLRKNLSAENGEAFLIDRVTDQVFSVRFLQKPVPGKPIVLQLRSPQGYGAARQYTLTPKPTLPEGTARTKLVHRGEADKYGVNDPILLLFSGSVSARQLKEHLQFSTTDKTDVTVINNIAVIKPRHALEYNKRYALAVTSGLEVNGQPMTQFSTQFFTMATPAYGSQDLKGIEYQQPITAPVEELTVEPLYGRNSPYSFDPKGSLTLVFSDSISESALRSHLEIIPSIEYGLYLSGGTAIITPDQPLEYSKEYIITVKSGLESGGGSLLRDAVDFEITTRPSSLSLTFTSADRRVLDLTSPIELEFALENAFTDHILLDLTLFRMNNYEQYRTILSVPELQDNFGLFELDSKTEILRTGLNRIQFDNPGKGIYLVQASVTDPETNIPVTFYQCFNVTELAVYMQIANDRTLAWVNSTTTAATQSGLKVELSDRTTRTVLATGTTGADGSCELTYVDPVPKVVKNQNDGVLSIYDAAGNIIYTDVTATLQPGSKPPELNPKFFTFFFTDRLLYHPTDTISFWGYVKPYLLNTEPLPPTLRVVLDKNGLNEHVDVPISPDGVFTGELPIAQVRSSQYPLAAYLYYPDKAEKEQLVLLDELYLEAKDFEKPTFILTSAPTKALFTSPEQIEVLAKLTFYDGTPVPSYPLELSVMNLSDGNVQEVRKVMTDESGTARFLFKPDAGVGSRVQNGPVSSTYTVTLAQDGETVRSAGTYTYQAAGLVTDVQLSFTSASQIDVTLRTNQLRSLTPAEAPAIVALAQKYGYAHDYYQSYQYDYDGAGETVEENQIQKDFYRSLAGRAADVGVDGTVTISYYSEQDGWVEQSAPIHAVTKGGLHRQSIQLDSPSSPESSVFADVSISCLDNNLNRISSAWSYNSKPPQSSAGRQRTPTRGLQPEGYSLSVTRNKEQEPLAYSVNQLGYNDQTVDLGDTLTFQLCRDGKPVANEGKLLYQLMQDQPLSQQVTTASSFQVKETFEYAQSVHIVAAYFDGEVVHPLQDTVLRANIDSAKLNVEIVPDREAYRPGDTVNLRVHVSNQDKLPLASNLCVSVVDESIFALKDQNLDVITDLYSRMAFPGINFKKYTTTLGDIGQYTGGDGGKSGGGIESYDMIRKDFRDTAFFYSAKTNAQGNAQISFQLPDNTTSWRVTTVSVGGALYGGNNKKNIISSLPFFSRPVITSKYLAGDEVVMLAKSNGTALSPDSQVNYNVRIQGNGLDQTYTAAGSASEAMRISFGELESGEYTVATTAQFSNYRDTVILPLTVIPSNLEMVVNREVDPAKLADLNISRYPLTLTFFDKQHAPFYKSISSLLTHFCCRADQRLSRYVAKKALARYMQAGDIPQHILDTGTYIADMQAEDGGISWYPESGEQSDPVLTTKVLMAVGNQFNTKRLLQYYQDQLDKPSLDPVTKAAVYAGLAVLGEPEATLQINRILDASSVAMQEKLYYVAGLAFGGDTEQALAIYNRDVKPYFEQAGDSIHLAYTGTQPVDDQLTSTAWLAASKLGLPDADGIALYFSKDSWGISHIFECMVYVDNYNQPGRSFSPIRYTANGAPGTLAFDVTGQVSATYNKGAFDTLSFQYIPEDISVLAYYIGEPNETELKVSKDITIQKEIIERESDCLNVIKVTLSKDAPVGSYDISDWIPSNMRFFSMSSESTIPYTQELQKMYFYLQHSKAEETTYTINYLTRKTFDAKTLQDRTYIIHADTGAFSYAERKVLAE